MTYESGKIGMSEGGGDKSDGWRGKRADAGEGDEDGEVPVIMSSIVSAIAWHRAASRFVEPARPATTAAQRKEYTMA